MEIISDMLLYSVSRRVFRFHFGIFFFSFFSSSNVLVVPLTPRFGTRTVASFFLNFLFQFRSIDSNSYQLQFLPSLSFHMDSINSLVPQNALRPEFLR